MRLFETDGSVLTMGALLIAMAAKHFIADFLVQTEWMARGKERLRGWGPPLAAHAGVHALGTLTIVAVFRPSLWWLSGVDLVVHWLIDRGKTLCAHRFQFQITDVRFWWLIGFDQFLHQATNVVLSVSMVAL